MKYLLEHEQRLLLKILRDSSSAARDRTVVELVLNTGLRIQELRLLNISDIWDGLKIRDHLIVRPETAKRSNAREIFLNSHAAGVLKGFIRWKRTQGKSLDPLDPLFVSKRGNRMGQRTLQDMAEKWFVKAGLVDSQGRTRYTFHSLRHTFAMNLRRRGINLERIQRLLGHSSLQATGIYVQPSREDLIEAVESLAA